MPDNSNYQFRAVPLNLVEYVTKKTKSSQYYFRYLLDRTTMMFKYKNLPDTIDHQMLERYLQVNGTATITKGPDGNLYAFNGTWGGEQDVYYRPTRSVIANPHISQLKPLEFTKECVIYGDEKHDGVLMRNDTEWASLTPLIGRYAVLMCENTLTVRTADIMLRIIALLSAGTDKALKSAMAYISKLEAGELSVIGDSAFMETIKLQSPPSNNGSYLTQFIELQQYLKGSFFNELGLRANYNMKREAIGEGESTLDADSILPLCDNMLMCRKEDVAKINELFGTDISVDFSSAWLENRVETSISVVSQLNESGVLDAINKDDESSTFVGEAGVGFDGSEEENTGRNGLVGSGVEKGEDEDATEDKGTGEEDRRDDEADADTGEVSERTGSEIAAAGEPGERKSSEDGEEGKGDEGEGNEVDREEIDQVKEELDSDELTMIEAVDEIVDEAISQLTAEARSDDAEDVEDEDKDEEGDGEDVSDGTQDSED